MNDDTGWWRWAVLFASFFNLLVNASVSYHVGVLNIALLDKFQSDPDLTAWLLSLYAAMYALAAPIGSVLVNLTNCRMCVFVSGVVSFIGFVCSAFVNRVEWLFLTITLAGIGQSLCQIGGTVILAFYFPTGISIMNGICLAGNALGSFVHPPLLQVLVDSYGLKWAFALLGAISLNSCIAGLIFRPTRYEEMKHNQEKSDRGMFKFKTQFGDCYQHLKIFRDPAFTTIMLAIFVYSVAYQTIIIYLPEYVVEKLGLSPQEASMVAATIGIGSVVSRVFAGFAAGDPSIGASLMFIGMNAMSSLVCMTASVLSSFHGGIYIISFSFGVYASATHSILNPLVLNIVDLDKAASGYGLVLLSFGCGSLVGPPVSAHLVHHYGQSVLFYFSGLMFLGASLLAAVDTFLTKTHVGNPPSDASLKKETDETIQNRDTMYPLLPNAEIEFGVKRGSNEDEQLCGSQV